MQELLPFAFWGIIALIFPFMWGVYLLVAILYWADSKDFLR